MTAKELIKILSKIPIETRILVDGYEDGFSDIAGVELKKVELNVNKEDFYGPHAEAKNSGIDALVISRGQNPLSR